MVRRGLEFEQPILELEKQIEELAASSQRLSIDVSVQLAELEVKKEELIESIYSKMSAWDRLQLARHPSRPHTRDFIKLIFEDFIELHGDRNFGDDRAIVGGMARLEGRSVMIIGQQKGRTTKERVECNFGSAHPEGYRKALRMMRLAEKFGLPVVSFVDTQGADPRIPSEERGQAHAIAHNLLEMAGLKVPIVVMVIGEGGSGGALGIGVGNRVYMLQYAVYYVCTPEACASILWKDPSKAPEAAQTMHITAEHLLDFGVIDEIIYEPLGGAHRKPEEAAHRVKEKLITSLDELSILDTKQLVENRYRKFRQIGVYQESEAESSPQPVHPIVDLERANLGL